MVERAINKPDTRTRQATSASKLEVHRRYFKLMDVLEAKKEGIAEMSDEDFDFLDRKYHQAELPLQKDISEILVTIDDAINKAKVEVKK